MDVDHGAEAVRVAYAMSRGPQMIALVASPTEGKARTRSESWDCQRRSVLPGGSSVAEGHGICHIRRVHYLIKNQMG